MVLTDMAGQLNPEEAYLSCEFIVSMLLAAVRPNRSVQITMYDV